MSDKPVEPIEPVEKEDPVAETRGGPVIPPKQDEEK